MPLTKREAFKVAFLERCAQEGLSLEEINDRLDVALLKIAGFTDFLKVPWEKAWDVAGKTMDTAKNVGLVGMGVAPFAVGSLLGAGAAKLTDARDLDADETKKYELLSELRRLTHQAHTRTQMAQKRRAYTPSMRPRI